jgi:eukaryotic-like serine/threonine-protein kinase
VTPRTLPEPAPGLEIGESLRLVKKLGQGGMGSVWIADHLALHTQVAVKFVTEHLSEDGAAIARFRREATAAAQIKSPHVVQVFDHGLLGGLVPYIVMELLEGQTLSDFLRRQGPLPPATIAHVISHLCKALTKAHALGIVHRDIKPDNVFLIDADGDLFAKLLDFGIAKMTLDSINVTSTGVAMGTAHYMSPEQVLSAKHVDLRSDLWAVGVVAYQCLTANLPFQGETFGAVAVAISLGNFAAPYAELGMGSPALDAWFKIALAREPSGRFASARAMSDALQAACGTAANRIGQSDSRSALRSSDAITSPTVEVGNAMVGGTPATFVGLTATASRPRRRGVYALAAITLTLGIAGAVILRPRARQVSEVAPATAAPPAVVPEVLPRPLVSAPAPAASIAVTPKAPIATVQAAPAVEKAAVPTAPRPKPTARPQKPEPAKRPAEKAVPALPSVDRGF